MVVTSRGVERTLGEFGFVLLQGLHRIDEVILVHQPQENCSMAKRESSEFSMAEEIRSLLKENRKLSGKEVLAALQQKFPKQAINTNSCMVAFSMARKSLGIRTVRRARPGKSTTAASPAVRPWAVKKKAAPVAAAVAVAGAVAGIELLVAAKGLLEKCGGDPELALGAIRQLAALQMK